MDIVEKSREVQKDIEDKVNRLGKGKYGRVIKMARKPDNEEFITVIEITGLGLALIGALGFLIYWIWTYLPGVFG